MNVSLVSGRYTAARFGPQAVRHCIQDFFVFFLGRTLAPMSHPTDAFVEDTDERNALHRKNKFAKKDDMGLIVL